MTFAAADVIIIKQGEFMKNNSEKVNFGRYGKTFQEGLVQLIYDDRPFADQITEVLDINFLELEYLRVFVKKIISIHRLKQFLPF